MTGMKTIGEDNVLKLTVVVSHDGMRTSYGVVWREGHKHRSRAASSSFCRARSASTACPARSRRP